MQGHASTCLLRPPTHNRLSRDKRAGALPLRWLSLGRRRSTRARDAHAVRCAGFDRPMRPGKPLHQQEASSIRCKAVVRCVRCGLPHIRLSRDKRTGTPLRWLSLGRRRSTRACDARAPHRNGCGRSTRYRMTMHQRDAFSIRCKAVVRCVRCSLPLNRLLRGKCACPARHCAGYLLKIIMVQHARLRRTRAALRCLWSACVPRKATPPAGGLLFGARPCCDVSAAASNTQPAFAWPTGGRATALAISPDEAQHARLRRACAALR